MVAVRSVQEAMALELCASAPEALPEVVRETEAEWRRRRRWQPLFPCPEEPRRYLELFETARVSNVLVCRALGAARGARAGASPGGL